MRETDANGILAEIELDRICETSQPGEAVKNIAIAQHEHDVEVLGGIVNPYDSVGEEDELWTVWLEASLAGLAALRAL